MRACRDLRGRTRTHLNHQVHVRNKLTKSHSTLSALTLTAAASLLLAACSGGAGASGSASGSSSGSAAAGGVTCASGSITAVGSTALQPLIEQAAKQYQDACSGATVNVQGGGSGTGLSQVLSGGANIGNSDIFAEEKLKPADATQLVDHKVVKQGWVMVVNPSVTGVTNLTKDQATQIWTGKITNWKDVGGSDAPIVLVIRPESSGTRATFKKLILGGATEASGKALTEDSNGAVTKAVESTPGATSIIGFAYFQQNKQSLTGLQLDGVEATVKNMADGSYKLAAFGHMYTKGQPSGVAKAFLDYMLSDPIQKTLVPKLFYAPVQPGS
ncbi:MAG: phosphate-binding protein [Chloroflexi bacterium]|nr:MAG: phosphate-binding protein [Chloroflexota bacterium]